MRFFVLLLLVLLLPLRGGMGDAMAISAAPTEHALQDCAGHSGSAKAHTQNTHAHDTHANEQVHADLAAEPVATTVKADCDACSACQTCHAVALVFSAAEVSALPAPHAAPAAVGLQFASAPAARDQKPPIS